MSWNEQHVEKFYFVSLRLFLNRKEKKKKKKDHYAYP